MAFYFAEIDSTQKKITVITKIKYTIITRNNVIFKPFLYFLSQIRIYSCLIKYASIYPLQRIVSNNCYMILTVLPLSIQFILVHNDNDDIAINFAMLDISK
jgi:hypothetical protein